MEGSSLQIQEELLLAKQSRLEGNEGRARVCARRAAGAAAQHYLLKEGITDRSENVLESLQTIKDKLSLPERVATAVIWLLQRVDLDHNLPSEVDLINEAEIVIAYVDSGAAE
jgi:hypothetical protein